MWNIFLSNCYYIILFSIVLHVIVIIITRQTLRQQKLSPLISLFFFYIGLEPLFSIAFKNIRGQIQLLRQLMLQLFLGLKGIVKFKGKLIDSAIKKNEIQMKQRRFRVINYIYSKWEKSPILLSQYWNNT